MEESYKIRKDRVKNIAIIFLVVMLVLTFFSNSILNRSLPEVATSYVERGTITEKIRGNGIVEAQDPYKIVATGSRKIASVPIKEGDMVTKDQVLFQLEDAESDDLKKAEEALNELIQTYTVTILNDKLSNESYETIQNGKQDSTNAYKAQIEAAKNKVKACQDNLNNIEYQIFLASNNQELTGKADLTEATNQLEKSTTKMNDAQTALSAAETELSTILIKSDGTSCGLEEFKTEVANKKIKLETTLSDYKIKKKALIDAFAKNNKEEVNKKVKECFADGEAGLLVSPDKQNELKALLIENYGHGETAAYEALFETLNSEGKSPYKAYAVALDEYNTFNGKFVRFNELNSIISSKTSELSAAKAEVEQWKNRISELNGEAANSQENKEKHIAELNILQKDAQNALEKAQEEQTQLIVDIGAELDLFKQNDAIAKMREEIAKLKEKETGATIVSPVDGMVLSVSKVAGEEIAADEEIATIQVAGKDMMVSFPVTKEQAAKVKVGDKATLQNSWYYDGVEVTLYKIKPDKDNPSKNKILEFIVKGDVQNGESLGLEIGQRSRDYDYVVPNSAVREDKKGKFILIIEEKSTPFGNRYKAKRYNVEVLASDETSSAIGVDGELQGWEYVITTSNIPVEAGSQVRLAEY